MQNAIDRVMPVIVGAFLAGVALGVLIGWLIVGTL